MTELIAVNQARTLSGLYAVAVDPAHGWPYVTDQEGLLAINELSGEVEEVLPAQALPHPFGLEHR